MPYFIMINSYEVPNNIYILNPLMVIIPNPVLN